MEQRSRSRLAGWVALALLGAAAFVLLLGSITSKPKRLVDFDQTFYLTIAYDLDRHGVFSNGVFDNVPSTLRTPPPGMFFTPLYPALVWAAMKLDARFDRAVACAMEFNDRRRPLEDCEVYARPIHVIHALLLAGAVVAIGLTAQALFPVPGIGVASGGLALLALLQEGHLFSYAMTESLTIALVSLLGFCLARALRWGSQSAVPERAVSLPEQRHGVKVCIPNMGRNGWWALAGLVLGLLCLTRLSFLVMVPVVAAIALVAPRFLGSARRWGWRGAILCGVLACSLLFAWSVRNAVALGKWKLSEEYGSAVIVERLAYNAMTTREFALAFPYCLPTIGPAIVASLAGPDAMQRFGWDKAGGFFDLGRSQRSELVSKHERLDPIVGPLIRKELTERWRGYLISIVALGWCGLWIFQTWSLVFVPLFAAACVIALRRGNWPFLLVALPGLVMVGLHAALANHYPRYNLGLVGPMAIAGAWLMLGLYARLRARRLQREN